MPEAQFDIVHLTTGFADAITDHNPTMALFRLDAAIMLGSGNDDITYETRTSAVAVMAGAGDDPLTGTRFADTLFGGDGFDRLRRHGL